MTITITRRCPFCGALSEVSCEDKAMRQYEDGTLAQVAFADMDFHDRETIISGMCVLCQESFFGLDGDDCDRECDMCMDFDCPGNASYFAPQDN